MEHADIERLLSGEMRHTREERLPERPIMGPFGKGSLDIGVVDGRLAMCILRYRQALPLHPRVEHPQDEVEDTMIAQFALWPAPGHREVRQEKCGELALRELDGDRRRCRLCCRYAHHARTSCAGYCHVLEDQITSYPTRGWEHLQNSQPLKKVRVQEEQWYMVRGVPLLMV